MKKGSIPLPLALYLRHTNVCELRAPVYTHSVDDRYFLRMKAKICFKLILHLLYDSYSLLFMLILYNRSVAHVKVLEIQYSLHVHLNTHRASDFMLSSLIWRRVCVCVSKSVTI